MSTGQRLAVVLMLAAAALLGVLAWRAQQPAAPAVVDTGAITLTTLDGETVRLSDWRGRIVLVNFWASWCAPCRNEMPMLDEMAERYADQGFVVLGPALDTPEAARRAAQELGVRYPLFAGDAEIIAAMNALGDTLGALPFSVLLDREGRVLDRRSGELRREDVERWIERAAGR